MNRYIIPLMGLLAAGCAAATVDMNEPRRVVGTETSVRIDAEISGDELTNGASVPIVCEITNQRTVPIAVGDLIPETSYDPETKTITVTIGSEVPGEVTLPRLIRIDPGEKKTLNAVARIALAPLARAAYDGSGPRSALLRIKVNFLGDVDGFQELLEMSGKEKMLVDPKLAERLFPLWLERNEVVYTNAVPMHWKAAQDAATSRRRPGPIRRRGTPYR